MKIALLSYLFDIQLGAGAAKSAALLTRGLADVGWEVVTIGSGRERKIQRYREGNITHYRFYPWNLYWVVERDAQPMWKKALWQLVDIWNPHVYWQVRRILEREKPDIVHVQKLRGLSPAVWAAAQAAGCPIIVQTCRDYEMISPDGALTGRVGEMARRGTWPISLYQQVRARLSRAVRAATAPSRYTLNAITQRGFFPRAHHQVVYNSHGYSTAELAALRQELTSQRPPTDRLRFLFLGRLKKVKGIDLLCEAFVTCAAVHPHIHLDIAGWGPLDSHLAQHYGHHPQITLHGPVFGEAKKELLTQADVMVVPSVWPEVLTLVALEAYAFGMPVIVTSAGGLPEIVAEEQTGWLIPPGDVNALAKTLADIAADPQSVHRLGEGCFEAAQAFALDKMLRHYEAVYTVAHTV